jgi:hypothetical protein
MLVLYKELCTWLPSLPPLKVSARHKGPIEIELRCKPLGLSQLEIVAATKKVTTRNNQISSGSCLKTTTTGNHLFCCLLIVGLSGLHYRCNQLSTVDGKSQCTNKNGILVVVQSCSPMICI